MSRQWMYDDRCSPEFINGVRTFLLAAEANKWADGFIPCPCVGCKNCHNYSTSRTIHVHLFESGFMPHYNVWNKHGDRGVMMEDNEEEEDDDSYPGHGFPEYDDTTMREEDDEEEASDEPIDDLGRAIADAKRNCASDLENKKLQRMLEDKKKLLYPNCVGDKKKLGTTLELLQWKAENGVSDKGFGKLLVMIKNMLPKDNELPESTYESKKVVCPLGLEVQKIHACPNDCILYRGEYEDLNACPVCGALRYKVNRDNPGDVEGERPRKKIPAKVMWYAPIIPRLKRLFQSKEHAKAMRWHREDRKKDRKLRVPTDGSQWRKIERKYGKEFADDARNKNVYLGHHRFLPRRHPVRKKGKHFKGEADHWTKPRHRTGADVHDMVKDLKVIFGKGPDGQPIPNDANGRAPMRKKKSIFWDLPYWKDLEVHSAIDVMHVTKNLCVTLLGFLVVYGKTKDTPEAREDQQRIHRKDD
ncbi:uncharacterized protein LOC119300812, partial [Triticum dicoccoides]|uniref:uncharacterized protein LOC119300812 n=1 Tax=Triticum dicoccoides TaxID=85692 RepID=UPI00188F1559